jgi:hypothetical protein
VEQVLGMERIFNVEEERSKGDGYAARTKIHVIIHFYLISYIKSMESLPRVAEYSRRRSRSVVNRLRLDDVWYKSATILQKSSWIPNLVMKPAMS